MYIRNQLFPVILPILFLVCSCRGRHYRIPNTSMEKTIMMGDKFFVSKTDSFTRNDIVVFNQFDDDYSKEPYENGKYSQTWMKRVYRLIAVSGDIAQLKNGDVFINNKHIPLPPKALAFYEVLATQPIEAFEMDSYAYAPERRGDTLVYKVSLSSEEAFEYSQKKVLVLSIKRTIDNMTFPDSLFSRANTGGVWSIDNYGPLSIPSPGETIIVDSINYSLFHNIPGIHFGKNTVTEKLYFVMGDNRHGARDSRFIGLISHSKMYGVVK